jgi:hypothetical protein
MKKSKDDFVSFMQKIAKKIRDFSDIESRISNNSSISDRDMFVVVDFIKFFSEKMNLSEVPKISLIPEAGDNHSTGAFNEKSKTIEIVTGNRLMIDVIRTIAHELTHYMQNKHGIHPKHSEDSETEDLWTAEEKEAYVTAGNIAKSFARYLKRDRGINIYSIGL